MASSRQDLARLHDEAHRLSRERDALAANLGKKILTTGVGALARFEAFFGRLWGDGKPDDELTEDERLWRRQFQACRVEIFDCANAQIRGMRAELSLHTVEKSVR